MRDISMRFLSERKGSAALEYALIASLVSIAIILGAAAIGTKLSASFYGPVAGALP